MSSGNESMDDDSWIDWFLSLEGNEFFCEVPRSYITDNFNLYGLRSQIAGFTDALETILDSCPSDSDDSSDTAAAELYGLIHARYIITARGMDQMYRKYLEEEFGICPRAYCDGQPVLPIGLRDDIGLDHVYVFCPKCEEIYSPSPRSEDLELVDGACFGSTFAHLFIMQYNVHPPKPVRNYTPRIYGYKVFRHDLPLPVEPLSVEGKKENDSVAAAAGAPPPEQD